MLLPNRHESSNSYKYGFNGMEKDDEVSGEGNSYTAEYWQYDSRLGRRWNIDPVVKTHESPYATFANNPIWFVDPSGADSTLYLFSSTENSSLQSGTGNMEKIGDDILEMYNSQGIDWLKEVKIVYDKAEFDGITNNLDYTDGVVNYTDDKSLGLNSDDVFLTVNNSFAEGITRGNFMAYVYVGENTKIDDAGMYALSYAGGHEFLHQIVSRIGYVLYGNINFYQSGGHFEGGLLTDANDMHKYGGVVRPAIRGTGIEQINPIMFGDVKNYSKTVVLLGKLDAQGVTVFLLFRYKHIMDYKEKFQSSSSPIVNFADPKLESQVDKIKWEQYK